MKTLVLLLAIILIYIAKGHRVRFHHSRIDVKYSWSGPRVNLVKYPLYMFAKHTVFTLKPGDCLYIPSKWWHWVFSLDENIAINVWFDGNDHRNLSHDLPFRRTNTNYAQTKLNRVELQQKLKNIYPCGYRNVPNTYSYRRPTEAYSNVQQRVSLDTFSDFLEKKLNYPYGTFYGENIDDELNLSEYVDILPNSGNISTNLWYYDGKSNSGLHNDESDNYLFQFMGYKKIFLFHPEHGKYLYADTILENALRF